MKSYRVKNRRTNNLQGKIGIVGERIEVMIEMYKNNTVDLEGKNEMIFTERKDGVIAGYDIRTDRFEVALEASSKIEKSYTGKREERLKIVKDPEGDSVDGTANVEV